MPVVFDLERSAANRVVVAQAGTSLNSLLVDQTTETASVLRAILIPVGKYRIPLGNDCSPLSLAIQPDLTGNVITFSNTPVR